VEKHLRRFQPGAKPTADSTAGLPCQRQRRRSCSAASNTFVQQAVAQSLELEKSVSVTAYLTLEEVAERYRYKISDGTLRNWRSKRIGPSFIKVGKAILYPIEELERWDRLNLISCSRVSIASFGANKTEGEVD
jgi:hypothetical protein